MSQCASTKMWQNQTNKPWRTDETFNITPESVRPTPNQLPSHQFTQPAPTPSLKRFPRMKFTLYHQSNDRRMENNHRQSAKMNFGKDCGSQLSMNTPLKQSQVNSDFSKPHL
ncbi:unnamed protein product [Choristocarpus tenellus]